MKNHQSNGFSIIELVIAIAVFAILVPAISAAIVQLGVLNERARDMAIIHGLVENKIEGLRSVSYGGVGTGTTTFTDELPTTIIPPRSASYTVSTVSTGLKQVDLSISYNDHGTQRTVSYRTYLGELGVGQY